MSILVLFSLIVKVFGAGLEIVSQAMISRGISVETYGTYAFFITIAEGIYSLFFSGIVKFNNYYIPLQQDIRHFRKRFYLRYVLPLSLGGMVVCVVGDQSIYALACLAGMLYFSAMDHSSRMMSVGRYKQALVGEYCVGRLATALGIGLLVLIHTDQQELLYIAYAVQFIVALSYYYLVNRHINKKQPLMSATTALDKDATKKYVVYQSSDIAHTITMQSSVIVQYLFVGAYETALVSIVLIVRRLVNFVTGPMCKLYQPEFARKYHARDRAGLADTYAQITRTQLCFILPAFTLLISQPELLLQVYNSSLIPYGYLVRNTAFVFLFMVMFGPLTNFLCMTEHEKYDTSFNWISVFVMYATMFLLRNSGYFVVFGFCTQIVVSTACKLWVYLRYMKCLPMPLRDYIRLLGFALIASILLLFLPTSFLLCVLVCAVQFVMNFAFIFPRDELCAMLSRLTKKQ